MSEPANKPTTWEVRATQLKQDVALLGQILGNVIGKIESPELVTLIEKLRVKSTQTRIVAESGDVAVQEELIRKMHLEKIEPLVKNTPEIAAKIAKAFGVLFHLINQAEETHRIRRCREYENSLTVIPNSYREIFERVRQVSLSDADFEKLIRELRFTLVFTKHPTESLTPDQRLRLEEVGSILLEERNPITKKQKLTALIEILWGSPQIRDKKPTVVEEAGDFRHILKTSIIDATVANERMLRTEIERTGRYAGKIDPNHTFFRLEAWIDLDGNPIAAETVQEILSQTKRDGNQILAEGFQYLGDHLTFSKSALKEKGAFSNEAALADPGGKPLSDLCTLAVTDLKGERQYKTDDLIDILDTVERALVQLGAEAAVSELVTPLRIKINLVERLNLHVRENSKVVRRILDLLTKEGTFTTESFSKAQQLGQLDAFMQHDKAVRKTKLDDVEKSLSTATDAGDIKAFEFIKVLGVIAAFHQRFGLAGCDNIIISMTSYLSDVRSMHLLGDTAGVDPECRYVPLVETGTDLKNAGKLKQEILQDPFLRPLVDTWGFLEFFTGYSDAGLGRGPEGQWRIQTAQEELIKNTPGDPPVRIFHGHGGVDARGGGGPMYRTIRNKPPGTFGPNYKGTFQGETIRWYFGNKELANRSLTLLMGSVIEHSAKTFAHKKSKAKNPIEFLDKFFDIAGTHYHTFVFDNPYFPEFFSRIAPDIGTLNLGSRPDKRTASNGNPLLQIRAIPFGSKWYVARMPFLSWFGLGKAAESLRAEQGEKSFEQLRAAYATYPPFRGWISAVEYNLARAAPVIALYLSETRDRSPGKIITKELFSEYKRTVEAVRQITEKKEFIAEPEWEATRAAIALRNPYIDVLSCLLLSFMEQEESLDAESPDKQVVEEGRRLAHLGIIAGMRGTG